MSKKLAKTSIECANEAGADGESQVSRLSDYWNLNRPSGGKLKLNDTPLFKWHV